MKTPVQGRITRHLVLSFCLLILIFFLYGIYSLYDIRAISNLTREIYDHPYFVSNAALGANVSITKMHRNMKDIVLFESPARIQQAIAAVNRQERMVYYYLDIVRDRILGEKGSKLEKEARVAFDQWRPIREEVMALVRQGKRFEAAEITVGKGARYVEKLEEKMIALTSYARSKASSFMRASEKTRARLTIMSRLFLVLAIGLSLLIAIFTLKRTASAERESFILKTAVDQAPVGIALADKNINLYYCNAEGLGMRGGNIDDLVEIPKEALVNWRMLRVNGEPYAVENFPLVKAVAKGDTIREEVIIRHQDGTDHICEASAHPVYQNNKIIGGMIVFLDVTERRLTELRIEHLNRVLRAIRDVNQLIVRERDPEALIREGCRLMVENRGYISAFILLTEADDRFITWAGAGAASFSDTFRAMFNRQELPPCCEMARTTAETIVIGEGDGVCGTCPIAGECGDVSSLCARLIHENKTYGYLVAASDRNIDVEDEELSLFTEMAGDLAYALSFIRLGTDHDLSERKREKLETQLIQAQKMESVGRLAGGVAHDYNNMLSIIIGYAELAMEKVKPDEPVYFDIREIFNAALRSSDITRQLLAFARQQTTAPKVIDLNAGIEGMLKMLRRLIGEDINLAWRPGADLWPVKIDPSQVDQILANLCVNARDAIVGPGKITIETGNTGLDEEYCADHVGFVPGEYVLLAVSDTGHGISSEMLDKIFEPFFTTKRLNQGTGLGLSTVYGIVKQNNGFINVYSEPEKGATIKVYLPRHAGQVVEVGPERAEEMPLGRGETVLLVEDDASILKLGEKMLRNLGYRVLTANSPQEAINLAGKHADEIKLLITDVVMPEMNGRELSDQLNEQRQDLKTLFMSGYTANVIAHRGVLEEGVHFIAKPLSIAFLKNNFLYSAFSLVLL